jgi:hypothetical protein
MMKLSLCVGVALGFAAVAYPSAHAAALVEPSSGVAFEDRPLAEGRTYLCVGAGMRKILFWSVYAIDFCVEEGALRREMDRYFAGAGSKYASLRGQALAEALDDAPSFFDHVASMTADKRAELVFLRDAGADAVRDGFGKNLLKEMGNRGPEKAAVHDFVAVIDHDVRKGDRAVLATRAGELTLTWGDRSRTLRRTDVERAFWRAYLGPDSPVPSLKHSVARGVAALWR